jgi:hypothetical protein
MLCSSHLGAFIYLSKTYVYQYLQKFGKQSSGSIVCCVYLDYIPSLYSTYLWIINYMRVNICTLTVNSRTPKPHCSTAHSSRLCNWAQWEIAWVLSRPMALGSSLGIKQATRQSLTQHYLLFDTNDPLFIPNPELGVYMYIFETGWKFRFSENSRVNML